jgi:hypothetical protein
LHRHADDVRQDRIALKADHTAHWARSTLLERVRPAMDISPINVIARWQLFDATLRDNSSGSFHYLDNFANRGSVA